MDEADLLGSGLVGVASLAHGLPGVGDAERVVADGGGVAALALGAAGVPERTGVVVAGVLVADVGVGAELDAGGGVVDVDEAELVGGDRRVDGRAVARPVWQVEHRLSWPAASSSKPPG